MHRILIYAALLLILALPFLVPPSTSRAQPPQGDGRPDQTILQLGANTSLAAVTGYLSPITEAARPFTHMLLRRDAYVPEGAELTLAVRVSVDGSSWTDWHDVGDNDDLWQPADGPDVEWSATIDVGGAARFWQVRGQFTPSPQGGVPVLRRVDVNTIDTRTFAPAQAPPATRRPTLALARPDVVSRVGWGSPDGESSRVPPNHYPANHMVVHHTADSNTLLPGEPNWAARVRAEWSFHTFTRGWGDVGYNYLIDPNGVIYEGRAGGDDAVAFHDTANYGSMGVVLIGTYATVPPTDAAQNALVQLLAWKAAQKGIDPLGSSYYYGCSISSYCHPFNSGSVVPNIAGHRQVTPGHTSCPGDQVIAYLPGIRLRVKQALSGGPTDNGDLTIDDLESGFTPNNANWHAAGCGYGGHTYWTYATNDPNQSSNSAIWRPNIPAAGTYRVYAHIPQGCGLAPPPYASISATYTISYAGGTQQRTIDHNTATEWVDLGVYPFDKGTAGTVRLTDLAAEPFDQQKVIFFDAIKWVPENAATTGVAIQNVAFDRTTITSGELLKVTFTVSNTGSTTLHTQEPQASRTPDGTAFNDGKDGRPDDAYVYDQAECFASNKSGSYAAFPKESNRFRVVLGPTDLSSIGDCAAAFGNYPWRWGLNGDLPPGETRDIVGYVRFRVPGTYTLRANALQEYVKYYYDLEQGIKQATITVTPEQFKPDVASYDALLNPLAQVYQLGEVPDNFLARTHNPLSIPRHEVLGSFRWQGEFTNWRAGGPLPGLDDNFIVEQVRSFVAPISGPYTFGISSDDGAWLWVDGQLVVDNWGLHAILDPNEASGTSYSTSDVTGTLNLSAGAHTIAFKYFERSGFAAAGYGVQMPGETTFRSVPDGLGGGVAMVGATFVETPTLRIAADDTGGSGIAYMSYSWDGKKWYDNLPCTALDCTLLNLGMLQNGAYHVYYKAVDKAGNESEQRELVFNVNTALAPKRTYLPFVGR
jgi:N-acetylmuramoyl-L-alanine amidase/PA14 domain